MYKYLLFGLFYLSSVGSTADSKTPLFKLERSTNKNQVIYDIKVTDKGIAKNKPIHPYWKMLAKDGHREELTSYENSKAYGVDIKMHSSKVLKFSVQALPTYPITVTFDEKTKLAQATMHLMNKDLILKNIYLKVSEGLIPKVQSIEIQAQESVTSEVNKVILTPLTKGKWREQLKKM